eukprot:scaffold5669_cov144-Skeletonema_menzelii.AAC.12
MGTDNTREAAVIGDGMTRDVAAYEAAATLASLISAPVSTSDTEEKMTYNEPMPIQVYSETTSTKKVEKFISHDKNSTIGTRKFTRDDDINLIRGILKHGKSSWKKIWQDAPELQHIKHAALKDRGRSKRFQNALEKALEDPSLLDRPDELLGDVHSSWYEKASGNSSTKNDSNEKNDSYSGAERTRNWRERQRRKKVDNPVATEAVGLAKPKPIIEVGRSKPSIEVGNVRRKRGGKVKAVEPPIEVVSARPLFMSGPLQDGNEPTIVSMAAPCNSGSYSIHMAAAKMLTDAARATTKRSGAETRVTTKRSAAAAKVKSEATYNKRPKLKQESKPNVRNNKKGLRTLQNGEVDEFPGWTCEKILRKNSTHYDRLWSHKSLDGVNVRSRVGMRDMMEKMERGVTAKTAYEMLMSEGKTKYFKRT